MPPSATDHSQVEDTGAGPRLDSWKEIATYLSRGERTVKRWEVERGLPVRRVPGAGRAIVYAYSGELDDWLESRKEQGIEAIHEEEQEETARASYAPPDRQTDLDAVGSPAPGTVIDHPEGRLYWKLALAGMVAAAILGAGIYAKVLPGAVHPLVPGASSSSLTVRTTPTVAASPVVPAPEKALAHDLYLKGRFEWNKRTPESLERALDDFTEAIVHDPASAPAYSGLSDTYVLMHEYSSLRERDSYARAIAASKKAVELDDSLAEAHRSLAFAEVWGSWDYSDSDKQFRRAIDLDPRDPLTHLWFATAFEGMPGWHDVVLREFNRAQELDPSSPVILSNKGIWLFEVGERKAGFDLVRQVERDNPDFVAPHRYLAIMYWILRDYPDFLAENEKAASLKHDDILMEITQAALAGFRKDGEKGLLASMYSARKKFDLKGDEEGPSLAEICLRLGKREEAIQLLQSRFDHRKALTGLLLIPDFDVLKEDPRYRQLLAKMNTSAAPLP